MKRTIIGALGGVVALSAGGLGLGFVLKKQPRIDGARFETAAAMHRTVEVPAKPEPPRASRVPEAASATVPAAVDRAGQSDATAIAVAIADQVPAAATPEPAIPAPTGVTPAREESKPQQNTAQENKAPENKAPASKPQDNTRPATKPRLAAKPPAASSVDARAARVRVADIRRARQADLRAMLRTYGLD